MLTEREIFDQMKTQLSSAANDCDLIAKHPESGEAFMRMRASLKLVEGCCRQAAHWREDTRWLVPGRLMEEAHQKARFWLHRPSIEAKKLFKGLASALRKMNNDIRRLEVMKTGRTGTILPVTLRDTSYQRRVHQVMTPGGIILPSAV